MKKWLALLLVLILIPTCSLAESFSENDVYYSFLPNSDGTTRCQVWAENTNHIMPYAGKEIACRAEFYSHWTGSGEFHLLADAILDVSQLTRKEINKLRDEMYLRDADQLIANDYRWSSKEIHIIVDLQVNATIDMDSFISGTAPTVFLYFPLSQIITLNQGEFLVDEYIIVLSQGSSLESIAFGWDVEGTTGRIFNMDSRCQKLVNEYFANQITGE